MVGLPKWGCGMWFASEYGNEKHDLRNVPAIWLTNIRHPRLNPRLPLNTMAKNLVKYPTLASKNAYRRYDNYNALEVPYCKAIPSDHDGFMGVPISFLDKFNPQQFELAGSSENTGEAETAQIYLASGKPGHARIDGKTCFKRLFIRLKR